MEQITKGTKKHKRQKEVQEEAENTLIQFGLWIDNKPMEHISVTLCTVLIGFNK